MRTLVFYITVALLCSACAAKIPAGDAPPAREPARPIKPVSFTAPNLLSQDSFEAYTHERDWIERLRASASEAASFPDEEQ